MILHLLKTEWQRLKRPVIAYWIVLLVTALPWFLRDPHSFQLPVYWSSGGSGELFSTYRTGLVSNHYVKEFLLWGNLAGAAFSWVLAAAIGLGGKLGRMVQPVRRWQHVAAKASAILLLLIAPQALVVATDLLLEGFGLGISMVGTLQHLASAAAILGAVALFAAWCPSAWHCLAGLAGLASLASLFGVFAYSTRSKFLLYPEGHWGSMTGWMVWLISALAIALLGCTLPWLRPRLGGIARVATAVGLTALAGFLASRADGPPHRDTQADQTRSEIDVSSIRPVIGEAWIEPNPWPLRDPASAESRGMTVNATITTAGCPAGYAVEWSPVGRRRIVADEASLAETPENPERTDRSFLAERMAGMFIPDGGGDRPWSYQAALAALPDNSPPHGTPDWIRSNYRYPTNLGLFTEIPGTGMSMERPMVLEAQLRGTVYRYERIMDVPLTKSAEKVNHGNLSWQARRFPSKKGELLADLVVKHPAVGFSSSPDEIRWDASPLNACLFYFHLPNAGTNIKAKTEFHADGPLLVAAGWHRTILAPGTGLDANTDFDGARLIVLRPVVVARIPAIDVSAPLAAEERDQRFRDFALNYPYKIDERIYQEELLPERPDPRTCSKEEFGRWLRIPASQTFNDQAQRDLACYAPRFAGMMAEVAQKESVQGALRRGTPESQRQQLLDAIATVPRPGNLIEVAIDRSWADEAREVILRRFREGALNEPVIVMHLEEPETYLALIGHFMAAPELDTYENLRLLPGIKPLLESAILEAMQNADLPELKVLVGKDTNKRPYGPYFFAAIIGNESALDGMLTVFNEGAPGRSFYRFRDLQRVIAAPPLTGPRYEALTDYLRDKTAADFQYDPLAQVWRPR